MLVSDVAPIAIYAGGTAILATNTNPTNASRVIQRQLHATQKCPKSWIIKVTTKKSRKKKVILLLN